MKIEFKINKLALVRDVFSLNNSSRQRNEKIPFPKWEKVENETWEKFCDTPSYYLVNPMHSDWALKQIFTQTDENNIAKNFSDISEKIKKIFEEISKKNEFKEILSETEEYKEFVQEQWNRNESFVINYFKDTLGIQIPDHTITVYIYHPKSSTGNADCETKTIAWGHSEDWKNYSSVYLAHEILHILTNKKYTDHNLMHAIIELATDNELRIRLNKGEEYFKMSDLDTEAPEWARKKESLKKNILSHWKEYLKLKEEDEKSIFDLEKKLVELGIK